MKQLIVIAVCITAILLACEKPETVSKVPAIELEDITFQRGVDTLSNEVLYVVFGLQVEDGDANIADDYNDSTGAGFYLSYSEKETGIYTPILTSDDDTVTYLRIDPSGYEDIFDKVGLNKTLSGRAEITLKHSIQFVNEHDTVAYRIFLKDQDENESNRALFNDYPLNYYDTTVYIP